MEIVRPESSQKMPDTATLVFHGAIFDVYQWQQAAYDGTVRTFEKAKRGDSVCCIAVTTDGKIILNREQQPGLEPFVGLPGGRVDTGEDPLSACQRELLEETGYTSEDWSLLSATQVTTKIDWVVYTFIARGCKKVAGQSLDGAEKIEHMFASFDEFTVSLTDSGYRDLKITLLEAKLDPVKMSALKEQMGLAK